MHQNTRTNSFHILILCQNKEHYTLRWFRFYLTREASRKQNVDISEGQCDKCAGGFVQNTLKALNIIKTIFPAELLGVSCYFHVFVQKSFAPHSRHCAALPETVLCLQWGMDGRRHQSTHDKVRPPHHQYLWSRIHRVETDGTRCFNPSHTHTHTQATVPSGVKSRCSTTTYSLWSRMPSHQHLWGKRNI